MAETGRLLGANRPSLGQPLARSAGREPWLAGYAKAWTGGSLWERRIRVRECRQQSVLDGGQGQPGLARGEPGGAARAVILLIPWVGVRATRSKVVEGFENLDSTEEAELAVSRLPPAGVANFPS